MQYILLDTVTLDSFIVVETFEDVACLRHIDHVARGSASTHSTEGELSALFRRNKQPDQI